MKQYQDYDPLHGNGKAMPHPKQPTRHSYRGGAFGHAVQLDTETYRNARSENYERTSAGNGNILSVVALMAACLGIRRGR